MVKEQNATIHFVDDRYETVKAVAGEPSLSKVQVYMADWFVTAHSAFEEACNVVPEWSQHYAKAPLHHCRYDSVLLHLVPCSRRSTTANRARLARTDHQSRCGTCRGYSTQAEKDAAKETKGVRVISLTQFQELLNWGILMGVGVLT